MPLLYGEDSVKAFHRLQEEIMKASDDHSLFAWIDEKVRDFDELGLLADSPSQFAISGAIVPYEDWEHKTHYQMTNRGLLIDLHLMPIKTDFVMINRRGTYLAALDCPSPQLGFTGFMCIMLQKLPGQERQEYKRVHCESLFCGKGRGSLETLYVRQRPVPGSSTLLLPLHYFHVGKPWFSKDYMVLDVVAGEPPTLNFSLPWVGLNPWIPSRFPLVFTIFKKPEALSADILIRRISDGYQFVLMLGSISPLEVGFDIQEWPSDHLTGFEDLVLIFDPVPMETVKRLPTFEMIVVTQCYCEESEKCYDVTMYLSPDSYPPVNSTEDKEISSSPTTQYLLDRKEPCCSYEKLWLSRPV